MDPVTRQLNFKYGFILNLNSPPGYWLVLDSAGLEEPAPGRANLSAQPHHSSLTGSAALAIFLSFLGISLQFFVAMRTAEVK